MHCLICGNELKGCICSDCSFDQSLCAELYPTLAPVSDPGNALWKYRRVLFQCARSGDSAKRVFAAASAKKPPTASEPARSVSAPVMTRSGTAAIGKIIRFGCYPQSADRPGKTAIEWLVMDRTETRALLISKYALEAKPFCSVSKSASWATSDLRMWLNRDFLNTAFSEEERKAVCTTKNNTETYILSVGEMDQVTEDKVFLLSTGEAVRYFKTDPSRRCCATKYAGRGLNADTVQTGCRWWLRSPGMNDHCVAFVKPDGSVAKGGYSIYLGATMVRPAIWVDTAAIRQR